MPFFEEVEDNDENMESPNSRAIVEFGLDEILSTSSFDSQML